jgi:hypothetical protein
MIISTRSLFVENFCDQISSEPPFFFFFFVRVYWWGMERDCDYASKVCNACTRATFSGGMDYVSQPIVEAKKNARWAVDFICAMRDRPGDATLRTFQFFISSLEACAKLLLVLVRYRTVLHSACN